MAAQRVVLWNLCMIYFYIHMHIIHISIASIHDKLLTELQAQVHGTYDDVHFVVTTGCSGYQNWQSETLLYSWSKVKQPGRFTRIIAGCKTDAEKLKANTTAIPNHDNRILFYFVPDYSPDKDDMSNGGRPFWYFNKPYGFHKWLFDANNFIYESVLVLIDPDMIILKPFLFHIQAEAERIAQELALTTSEKDGQGQPRVRDLWVRRGHPVSQKYGIGAKWVRGNWSGFCDEAEYKDSDCRSKNERFVWDKYSVGPPYMMHTEDWKLVAPKWIEFSPLALKFDPPPSILAEMYSYVLACALYNLRHEYLMSMVSSPESSKYMENTHDIDLAQLEGRDFKFHILHFCHGYWLGQTRNTGTIRNGGWNFHKGHVPVDFLYDCDIPLLTQMIDDGKYSESDMQMYKVRDTATKKGRDGGYGKYGMVWILNVLIETINEAVSNYRMKYCGKEWKASYTLVLQQPEADVNGRRMNYILGDYDSGKSWKGA